MIRLLLAASVVLALGGPVSAALPEGRSFSPPIERLELRGQPIPLARGERVAAWQSLAGAPDGTLGLIAAVVWTGREAESGLELRVYGLAQRGWALLSSSAEAPTWCGEPMGCGSRQISPTPRIQRFPDGVLLVHSRAITMCQSGQDACAPLDIGVLYRLLGAAPLRLGQIPLSAYSGEEPATEALRHRLFHYRPGLETTADGLTLTLTPAAETPVTNREGSHFAGTGRKRLRAAHPATWRHTLGTGWVPVPASLEAWAIAAEEPRQRAAREAALEGLRALERGDPATVPWAWACLVFDDTGSGPPCLGRSLPAPTLASR